MNEKNEVNESFEGGWESEAFTDDEFVAEQKTDSEIEAPAVEHEAEKSENTSSEKQEPASHDEEPAAFRVDGGALKRDFLDFARKHPELKSSDIPEQVWAEVRRGKTLSEAYMRHENAVMSARLRELEQLELNRSRAAGSRSSAGNTKGADPFDEGWREI